MTTDFKPGDIVRVRDTYQFLKAFENKIKDRDAVVVWVGPDKFGQFKGCMEVTFQKRGNRGKEFSEIMQMRDFVKVETK